MKSLIIIPTYNEIENIKRLLNELLERYPDTNILVVDEKSPDGTGNFVKEYMQNDDRVRLLQRAGKMGLSTAYVTGFRYMLDNGYDIVFQMDADYSHDPKEIKNFKKALDEYDLIVGSRYIQGVNVINWPMRRLLLSYFANKYTKIITGLPLNDSTGGFKCFKREVLESINLDKINSNGYAFQIEMNFKAWKNGYKLKELPIVFVDRIQGTSKMSKKIVREAVFMVWKLRFQSIFGKLN